MVKKKRKENSKKKNEIERGRVNEREKKYQMQRDEI